jgi:predicted N-acetyltransferase YhbS
MTTEIRRTSANEFKMTENITREAFWNLYKPGCDEHLVLHQLRESRSYVGELDLVAILNNHIVGHLISTKATVVDPSGSESEVLCVGPVSVLPDFQGQGIGSGLIRKSIRIAGEMGYPGMVLFGNPEYYHRFGFLNAVEYGITTKDGQNFEPFMVLELRPRALAWVKGRFFEDKAFETFEDDLHRFEKQFPQKEKGNPRIIIPIAEK